VSQSITHYGSGHVPEPVVSGEIVDSRIADVEALARWMDYCFVLPGGFRFGFAGIIGFIPGVGDIVDAIVSLYIVHRALQLGLPRVSIARMVVNVGIEGFAGAVPFIGDFFDIVFKANRRNYEILRSHMRASRHQSRLDSLFLVATGLIVAAAIIVPLVVLAWLIHRI